MYYIYYIKSTKGALEVLVCSSEIVIMVKCDPPPLNETQVALRNFELNAKSL